MEDVLTHPTFEEDYPRTFFENGTFQNILESFDGAFFISGSFVIFFALVAWYKKSLLAAITVILAFSTRFLVRETLKSAVTLDPVFSTLFWPVLIKFLLLLIVAAFLRYFTAGRRDSSVVKYLAPFFTYNKTTGAPSYHDDRRYSSFSVFHKREDLLNRKRTFFTKDPILVDEKILHSRWYEDGNVRLFEHQNPDLLYDFEIKSIASDFELFSDNPEELDVLPQRKKEAWRNFQLKIQAICGPYWDSLCLAKRYYITLGHAESEEVGKALIFSSKPSWTKLYEIQSRYKPDIQCLTPSPYPPIGSPVYQ